ncbi:hypothetical protein ACFLQY_02525 [Verrucomicrobiota bacterium]
MPDYKCIECSHIEIDYTPLANIVFKSSHRGLDTYNIKVLSIIGEEKMASLHLWTKSELIDDATEDMLWEIVESLRLTPDHLYSGWKSPAKMRKVTAKKDS